MKKKINRSLLFALIISITLSIMALLSMFYFQQQTTVHTTERSESMLTNRANVIPEQIHTEDAVITLRTARNIIIFSVLSAIIAIILITWWNNRHYQQLMLSKEDYRIASLHSAKYIFSYNIKTKTLQQNQSITTHYNIPPKITDFPDLIHPKDRNIYQDNIINRILAKENEAEATLRLKKSMAAMNGAD